MDFQSAVMVEENWMLALLLIILSCIAGNIYRHTSQPHAKQKGWHDSFFGWSTMCQTGVARGFFFVSLHTFYLGH